MLCVCVLSCLSRKCWFGRRNLVWLVLNGLVIDYEFVFIGFVCWLFGLYLLECEIWVCWFYGGGICVYILVWWCVVVWGVRRVGFGIGVWLVWYCVGVSCGGLLCDCDWCFWYCVGLVWVWSDLMGIGWLFYIGVCWFLFLVVGGWMFCFGILLIILVFVYFLLGLWGCGVGWCSGVGGMVVVYWCCLGYLLSWMVFEVRLVWVWIFCWFYGDLGGWYWWFRVVVVYYCLMVIVNGFWLYVYVFCWEFVLYCFDIVSLMYWLCCFLFVEVNEVCMKLGWFSSLVNW